MTRAAMQLKSADNDHQLALSLSSSLTQYWRRTQRPMAVQVTPEIVIAALNKAGIRPVLMGTYGLVGWRSEPRATLDVDVLVRKRDVRKAVQTISRAFPTLEISDTPVVTRFRDPEIDKVVIDLMKPTQAVFQLVFRHTISAGDTHDIPDLEMGLISKFAAMTSPLRKGARKGQDVIDFMDIVEHNRDGLDLKKLRRLAEKVYAGGGAEVIQLVDDILAGRRITI